MCGENMVGKKEVKKLVEKELAKCLENGLTEQDAIQIVRRNLQHSYSVKLVKTYPCQESGQNNRQETTFYKRLKNAHVEGTPRVHGELM